MSQFKERVGKIVSIYNIPLKERWTKYLGSDHHNYFLYLHHSSLTGNAAVTASDPSTYRLAVNFNIESYFQHIDNYFECSNYSGKVVIDVGCGWGLLSFWFAFSGAKTVYAIGYEYQVEFISKLIASAKKNKLIDENFNLVPLAKPLGKNTTTIGDLPEGTADYIVYNDVFEHIADHFFMNALKASYQTLKHGGRLISATHNTDNPLVLERIKKGWDIAEAESHRNRRRELIENKFGADEKNIDQLINETRGLLKEDFELFLDEYKKSGVIKSSETIRPAIDLDIDYICENYISPPAVVGQMKAAGFDATCYAGIYHTGRRFRWLQPVAKMFKSLFMNINMFSGTVVFVGDKK